MVSGTSFQGSGAVDPPDTDVDFYSFDADGPVDIVLDCKPAGDRFAAGYADLVVSVYDASHVLIARNDDPFPDTSQDPELLTALPGAGTYYLEVEEYCEAFGGCDPGYFGSLTNLDYTLAVFPVDTATPGVVLEAPEPNDSAATATVLPYAGVPGSPGQYFRSEVFGGFSGSTDVDDVAFTVPTDLSVAPGTRLDVSFMLPPGGSTQSGSGAEPGVAEIVDPITSNVISSLDFASEPADGTRGTVLAPLVAGTPYLLRAHYGAVAAGGASFQYILAFAGGGNPTEAEESLNDAFATAEFLPTFGASTSSFVEGDLVSVADVDHYLVDVQTGILTVSCAARHMGSGLQGFTASVLRGSNGAVLATGTETAHADLIIANVDPLTESDLVIKLTATSQAAGITGKFYRCGFHFQ